MLTDCIWISFHPWTLVYQRPEGASTPGYTALPCREVYVLAIYSGSNHEYILSNSTAMANSGDSTPFGYLSTHRCCSTRDYKVLGHMEHLFHYAGKSMFWSYIPDQTMNTHFLSPLQCLIVLTDCIWIPYTHGRCSITHQTASRHKEKRFCHEGK